MTLRNPSASGCFCSRHTKTCNMWKRTPHPGKCRTEPHGLSGLAVRAGCPSWLVQCGRWVPGCQLGTRWVQMGTRVGYQTSMSRRAQTSLDWPVLSNVSDMSDRPVRHVGSASQISRSDTSVGQSDQSVSQSFFYVFRTKSGIGALRNFSVSGLGQRGITLHSECH